MKIFVKTLSAVTALALSVITVISGCGMQSSKPESAAEAPFPLLWRVTGAQGNTVYLFGTIHTGDERSDKIADKLRAKLWECDALAVEFNIVDYNSNASRQANALFYMKNKDLNTVRSHMRADLLEKSMAYLKEHDAYFEALDQYNLNTWYSTLESVQLSEIGFSGAKSMDVLLIQAADVDGKEILEVESPKSQAKMSAEFPDELVNWQIEDFFEKQDVFADGFETYYTAWLNGDEATLRDITYTPPSGELTGERKQLWDDYLKTLLTDRNAAMANKAASYIDGGRSVFFAVGTAHFIGDDGIIKLLTDKGYHVERVGA